MRRIAATSGPGRAWGSHHATVSSSCRWTADQRSEAVRRTPQGAGAFQEDVGCWWSTPKSHGRAGPSLSTLSPCHCSRRASRARASNVSKLCAAGGRRALAGSDFGEASTPPGRHSHAVAAHLRRVGRETTWSPPSNYQPLRRRCALAMTSAGRARAARLGVDLPAIRATVRRAFGLRRATSLRLWRNRG